MRDSSTAHSGDEIPGIVGNNSRSLSVYPRCRCRLAQFNLEHMAAPAPDDMEPALSIPALTTAVTEAARALRAAGKDGNRLARKV